MKFWPKKRIFMDYAAGEDNPSGVYQEGVEAHKALEDARFKIARTLVVQTRDVVFTSGGTESDNLSMLGVFEAARDKFPKPHFIISDREHPAIEECAKEIERRGGEVTRVETEGGVVDASRVIFYIKESTVLVSIMYASNETGAINPVPKIARLVSGLRKKSGQKFPYVHTDASQAALYLPVDFPHLGVDLLTLDASKIYGPKGAALLVVRPNVALRPLFFGGGQERDLRSGTQNVSAVVGFAQALIAAQAKRESESLRVGALKTLFINELGEQVPLARVNTPSVSLPNIVSLSIPGHLHEFLAIKLDLLGIAVSTGSACNSNKNEEDKEALRFSFGRETSESDVKFAIRKLSEALL